MLDIFGCRNPGQSRIEWLEVDPGASTKSAENGKVQYRFRLSLVNSAAFRIRRKHELRLSTIDNGGEGKFE